MTLDTTFGLVPPEVVVSGRVGIGSGDIEPILVQVESSFSAAAASCRQHLLSASAVGR